MSLKKMLNEEDLDKVTGGVYEKTVTSIIACPVCNELITVTNSTYYHAKKVLFNHLIAHYSSLGGDEGINNTLNTMMNELFPAEEEED